MVNEFHNQNELYFNKYAMKSMNDLVGNVNSREYILKWARQWEKVDLPVPKALVFSGPPGTGKTATAFAIANDFKWPVVIMDPSETRNKSRIEKLISHSGNYGSFDVDGTFRSYSEGSRKLILIDEADIWFERDTGNTDSNKMVDTLSIFFNLKKLLVEKGFDHAVIEKERKRFIAISGDGKKVIVKKAIKGLLAAIKCNENIDEIFSIVYETNVDSYDVYDRGGVTAMIELIKKAKHPVILTVNDMSVLRKRSNFFYTNRNRDLGKVEFLPLNYIDILSILKKVKREEKLTIPDKDLIAIAKNALGDVRAAMNDLQSLGNEPSLEILGSRDISMDVEEFLSKMFSETDLKHVYNIYNGTDISPDRLIFWLDENVGTIFKDYDLLHTMELLSRADFYLTNARKSRHYGLWNYARDMMIMSVMSTKNNKVYTLRQIAFPYILKRYKDFNSSDINNLYYLFGKYNHMSKNKVKSELMDYISYIYNMDTHFRIILTLRMGLTSEMVALLLGVENESSKVENVFKECDASSIQHETINDTKKETVQRKGQTQLTGF